MTPIREKREFTDEFKAQMVILYNSENLVQRLQKSMA
jgi:hypothetical protein